MKEKEEYNFCYRQSVEKETEGGLGTTLLKRVFKKKIKGIKAEFFPSPYVGQTAFAIKATTMVNMRKAAKILKDYGYIDKLKDINGYVESI